MAKHLPKTIEIVTHFGLNDKDFSYDYESIDLKIDGKIVTSWGDFYHDKGDEKCEGFLEALRWVYGDKLPEPIKTDVADGEDDGSGEDSEDEDSDD